MKSFVCMSLLLVAGCSPRVGRAPMKFGSSAAALQPIPSPNQERMLHLAVNQSKADMTRYLCLRVDVKDQSGATSHSIQTPASDGMKWAIGWMDDSTIVLNSRDIGARAWKLVEGGAAQELPVSEEIVEFGTKAFAAKYGSQ